MLIICQMKQECGRSNGDVKVRLAHCHLTVLAVKVGSRHCSVPVRPMRNGLARD